MLFQVAYTVTSLVIKLVRNMWFWKKAVVIKDCEDCVHYWPPMHFMSGFIEPGCLCNLNPDKKRDPDEIRLNESQCGPTAKWFEKNE